MMIQPQIDFCCFQLVANYIALTHCYKLVSLKKNVITVIACPHWRLYFGDCRRSVAAFSDSRRFRRQSPFLATIVASVDRA